MHIHEGRAPNAVRVDCERISVGPTSLTPSFQRGFELRWAPGALNCFLLLVMRARWWRMRTFSHAIGNAP